MTDRGRLLNDLWGLFLGVVFFMTGIGLLFFWVIGTWMNSLPYLIAGIVCVLVGAYIVWYFGR